MSSAILLSSVLIHWEFMLSGELIRSKQKKRASNCPILDFLQVWLVAGYVEMYRVEILCYICCGYQVQWSTVVDDNSDKFEHIDGDEQAVSIVFFVYERTLDHFVREHNMPPESEGNRVPSRTFKAAVSKCRCCWCSWDCMSRGSTRKNVIFSNSLWTSSEYPISLKTMSIWSL